MKSLNNKKRRQMVQKARRFERLENRSLMAAEIFLDQSSGILYIDGTDAARDTAEIRIETKGTASTADDRVLVNLLSKTDASNQRLTGNYRRASVRSIVFNGYGNSDKFNNNTPIPSEADGGAGADLLLGGFGVDYIYGGDQGDYIDGRTGDDHLFAGTGNDIVFGDKGNDFLYGNSGNDFLFGGAGRDSIFGEAGADFLDGGADSELKMIGSFGVDTFIDDTLSFPGGDFSSNDIGSTNHADAAMYDYNIANDAQRSAERFADYLASRSGNNSPTTPTTPTTPTPPPVANLNAQVLAFAQSKLGMKVGDGGCTRLIEEALAAVGAKPGSNFNQPGYYVWGRTLAAGETMSAGDIIQFSPGTRFQTPNSSLYMDSYFGHAAIIESVNGTTITMLNQNLAGSPVVRTTVDLATIVYGSYTVYRAVPA